MKRRATAGKKSGEPAKKTKSADGSAKMKKPTPVGLATPEPLEHVQVLVFGGGDTSQLTNQYDGDRSRPSPLHKFPDVTVLDVQSAGYHTALLLRDADDKSQLWTWGCNDDGVLGRETKDDEEGEPTVVDLENVVKIAVGDYHMAALTADGKIYGWGSYKDEEGFLGLQLALGRRDRQRTPVEFLFDALKKYNIVDIASSGNTTCVLTSTGKVFQWGCTKQILPKKSARLAEKNDRQQLIPHVVRVPQKVVRIFSGGNHHFALTESGELYAWGINGYGQLGLGDNKPHEIPQKVEGLENVASASCGHCHSLVLTKDGTVYSFGRNAYGQLGLGDAEKQETGVEAFPSKYTPQKITWFSEKLAKDDKVIQVYAGSQHSACVTSKGGCYSWGFGETSRLGTGDNDDRVEPTPLTGNWWKNWNARRISCGSDFNVLLLTKKPAKADKPEETA